MQYAYYLSNSTSPSQVRGWYDNTTTTYTNMPDDSDLYLLNAVQWDARFPNTSEWAINTTTDPITLETYNPAPPALSLSEQAQIALSNGVTITSSSTSSLNGTYDCGSATQDHIQSEILSIILNGSFADGTTTVLWLDMANTSHTYNVVEFKSFAGAIGQYVAALFKVIQGTLTSLPASTVSIP